MASIVPCAEVSRIWQSIATGTPPKIFFQDNYLGDLRYYKGSFRGHKELPGFSSFFLLPEDRRSGDRAVAVTLMPKAS